MSARRVLVASYDVPHPDRDSGSRRIFDHLVYLLDAGWQIDYYAVHGVREGQRYGRTLRQLGIGVYEPKSQPIEELLEDRDYGLVLFGFWQVAEQYLAPARRLSPGARVVVDSIDLQFLRDARRSLGAGELLPDAYGSELVGELNVYAAADVVLTVSQKEADLIADLLARPNLAWTVPDGEDLAVSQIPFAERCGIVFVGSFRHAPNLDGVQYFCREILPLIPKELRDRHPVSIVGAGAADALPDGVAAQVDVVDWVPEVVPYLARARVSVVPLRFGAGTKRKLLQSLMLGTPAVSTSIGVEGLSLVHGEEVLVADDPAAFAKCIEALLVDEKRWTCLAQRGRRRIAESHSRKAVEERFLAALSAPSVSSAPPLAPPVPDPGTYGRRIRYLENQRIVPRIRELVSARLPASAAVAVVSDGQIELLDLGDRTAWHFPGTIAGDWLGTPGTDEEAIEGLEDIKAQGAHYLLVPSTEYWWFDHFPRFSQRLRERYELAIEKPGVCQIFRLAHSPARVTELVDAYQPAPTEGIRVREPEGSAETDAEEEAPQLVAFYLPQFHPIPENDAWWGDGFTEWTNVAKAKPLFEGHYQPHIPADLGFYDLRLPETRLAQAELARAYGISAFCYYHYWFNGSQLLNRPFDEVLASGEPDLPFTLCWANEPWSRRWNGRPDDVLQAQAYSRRDDLAHIRWLLPALADPRALMIEERPVFIVYQARDLPDPARTVETWRREVTRAGLPDPYLLTVETGWDEGWDATEVGFDAKIMFRPQFTTLRAAPRIRVPAHPDLEVRSYEAAWPLLARPEEVAYPTFETVCPRWDNSARTGAQGIVLHDSTPEAYEQWLRQALGRTMERPPGQRFVFLNAWNEWGEGCHLEPDRRWGHAYLEATLRELRRAARGGSHVDVGNDLLTYLFREDA